MNDVLRLYTEIDSLFDSKRGLVQKKICGGIDDLETDLANKLKESDVVFSKVFLDKYKKRQHHLFNVPEYGITPGWFIEAYKNRSIEDFDYYYPTPLCDGLFKIAMALEVSASGGFDFNEVVLDVNIYPYAFNEAEKELIISSLSDKFKGSIKINILSVNSTTLTSSFYGEYNTVFKADLLHDNLKFAESLQSNPIPKTKFIVPAIHYKQTEFKGNPEQALKLFALTSSPVMSLVVRDKGLYDCYL